MVVVDETLIIEEVPLTGNTGKLKVVATSFFQVSGKEEKKRKRDKKLSELQ